ncbi:MAG: endo-1,4-beta-xylanase [Vicinamibacteria bacterium]
MAQSPRGAARRQSLASVMALLAAACGSEGPSSPGPPEPAAPTAVQVDPLRAAASATGRRIGAALQASLLRTEPGYTAAAAHHFDDVTAEYEMKWGQIERQRGTRTYGPADEIVSFASARGMTVKGHALVWHGDSPAWLEALSPAEARQSLRDHVAATVGRYRGRVRAWDVVNEAIADDRPGLRDTVYLRTLGPDYIAEAFALAHEADPSALLIYNDYGGEGLNRKSDDVYALVSDLVARGVPIGGVGLQMHLDAASRPATGDIARNVARLAALGLRVNISEMDVRVARVPGDRAAKSAEQRRVYHDVVAVCLAEPRCDAVTFWGFTDRHSWIDAFFGPDDPLLFDDAYGVKPAYQGVLDALRGR